MPDEHIPETESFLPEGTAPIFSPRKAHSEIRPSSGSSATTPKPETENRVHRRAFQTVTEAAPERVYRRIPRKHLFHVRQKQSLEKLPNPKKANSQVKQNAGILNPPKKKATGKAAETPAA